MRLSSHSTSAFKTYLFKKEKILQIQNKALELSMFLSLPATAALFVGSEEIISALFGYGSFGNDAYLIQLKHLLFWFRFTSFCYDKGFFHFFFMNNDTKTPFYISVISVILNIFISLYYFKSIGFIIIPIATSISSWINAIILFIF